MMGTRQNIVEYVKQQEHLADHRLNEREPVILRLDGNSFHSFTMLAGFNVPFDDVFKEIMYESAKAVLEYCSGAMIAYIQSDEINVLLRNDLSPLMTPFLNNRVQKICSLVASVYSVKFNHLLLSNGKNTPIPAHFDCRCFTVPYEHVLSVFNWRQQDAIKNAVHSIIYWKLREQMTGKAAQRTLTNKMTSEKMQMLKEEHGIDIKDFPVHHIRGACIYKKTILTPIEDIVDDEIIQKHGKTGEIVERHYWNVDRNIPLFGEQHEFIERFIKNKETSETI